MESPFSLPAGVVLLFVIFAPAVHESWKIDISQQQDTVEGDLRPNLNGLFMNTVGGGGLFVNRIWPYGHIPYVIGPGYTLQEIRLIQSVIYRINHLTCIRFFPRTTQTDFIYILNTREGCYTTGIGRIGGPQRVSLQAGPGATCMYYDIIVHELLHVIGLGHEHNRADRDGYVRVHFDNVMTGAAHQFAKFSPHLHFQFSTPYDYSSIMHYHAYAFSKDGASATVEPLDSRFFDLIGNALDMSYYDLLKVANLYNCPGWEENLDVYCNDRSPHCETYISFCETWEVMWFYCHRTCGLCFR